MDAAGRRSIRRTVDDQDEDIRVVAPPFLFYILYDNDIISRREFCEGCGELLELDRIQSRKSFVGADSDRL
jgi:hypothetical protein